MVFIYVSPFTYLWPLGFECANNAICSHAIGSLTLQLLSEALEDIEAQFDPTIRNNDEFSAARSAYEASPDGCAGWRNNKLQVQHVCIEHLTIRVAAGRNYRGL